MRNTLLVGLTSIREVVSKLVNKFGTNSIVIILIDPICLVFMVFYLDFGRYQFI